MLFSGKLIRLATVAFASTVLMGAAAPAFAESEWDATHPRRDEVNDRLHNQDHRIRNEERRMAARDGGHITRADQHILNRQENRVSHQIGR